ncbi:MAG: type II toxin-antitoxin system VapC family toxin [Thermodesulfobacteriota bacterium]
MTDTTMFDTDVLIDAARGVSEAAVYLQDAAAQSRLAVSVVTKMELIVGCRNRTELRDVEGFLMGFTIVKMTEAVSDRAVNLLTQYRLSPGLLIADALIAATALVYDFPFVTKNRRDYRFIAGLNLLAYP